MGRVHLSVRSHPTKFLYLIFNAHFIYSHRGLKFGDNDATIQAVLWQLVKEHPTHTLGDFVNEFRALGVPVKRNFIQRIFSNWRWSWKKPAVHQVLKYTPANILYYREWVSLIPQLPLAKLKFCDESHFVARQLHRTQVIGPVGEQRVLRDGGNLSDSFSLTLLTDLATPDNPFYIDIRSDSNSEEDFFNFVVAAVAAGRLANGDFFIVDNASIHFGRATRPRLRLLFARHGISYLFLPTYSPELNPCELVFAFVKNYIRAHRTPEFQLPQLLLQALTRLAYRQLVNMYVHCVNILERHK